MLSRLWKPWFIYQPSRVLWRSLSALRSAPPGYRPIWTSWGAQIIADPTRTIGHSMLTTGVYDLAVSEALARLIARGDTVVDVGANVGYMTVLMCIAAGPAGKVISFEPHPELFAILQKNVTAAREMLKCSSTDLHQSALGDRPGMTELHIPPGFASNDGIARIGEAGEDGGQSMTVQVETLDRVLAGDSASVLKMDVEGSESQVLRGAPDLLRQHRVRHIVFEEHAIARSEVVRILKESGYQVLSLGWSMRGPEIKPVETGNLAHHYEAPSFIATLEPDEVETHFRPRGWLVLGSRLLQRCA